MGKTDKTDKAAAGGDMLAGLSGRDRLIGMVIVAMLSGGGVAGGSFFSGGDNAKIAALDKKLTDKIDALAKRQRDTEKKNAAIAENVSWIAGKLGMPNPKRTP